MSLTKMVLRSRHVYVIGNGGSYANAAHIVNDLLSAGVSAFTIDPVTLSAFANDYGWEHALARWIKIVGHADDLLIALSGSGKSPNILNAIKEAEALEMQVWREFGAAQGLDMQSAEEHQLHLGHAVMRALRGSWTTA